MKNDPEMMDRLLEEALAQYATEEPRPGIERRVLDRVYSKRKAWMTRTWALALAAACLLLSAGLWIGRLVKPQQHNSEWPTTRVAVASPQVNAHVTPEGPLRLPPSPRKRTRRAARPPKQAEFPVADPLTAEERGLLALATQHPQILLELQRPIEPIQIKRLDIEPLNPDGQP